MTAGGLAMKCHGIVLLLFSTHLLAADAPLPPDRLERMQKSFAESEAKLTEEIDAKPEEVDLYSKRADARFFQGRFAEAVADYDKMVELDPKLETAHWRRGIAYFYAKDYKKAAHQFEIYHSFDNV